MLDCQSYHIQVQGMLMKIEASNSWRMPEHLLISISSGIFLCCLHCSRYHWLEALLQIQQ